MALFSPIQIGDITLAHRVVHAPLTRYRADNEHVPILPVVKQYYTQRSCTPGTFIISEATFIAPRAVGYAHAPGIWTDEQIAAWKEIAEAVHASGGHMFLQLWALGRVADPQVLALEHVEYKAPSAIPLSDQVHEGAVPKALTIEEIKEYVQLYAKAASNAVHLAHFDGVEIHGANGYLVDEFLQDVSNTRTDEYGGSIEKRARFALEVVDAVVTAVGAKKVGIRFSPWGYSQDMRMKDPVQQFSYVISEIKALYPDFAYIHMIEPRISGHDDRIALGDEGNDVFRKLWAPKPFISAGGFKRADALKSAENNANGLVAFGRYFTSNPDLVRRLKEDIPLAPYNRSKFYLPGNTTSEGYTDFEFAK